MTEEILGPGPLWFDDARVGLHYDTAAQTVTEADVVGFAGISGDHHEVHTNAELMRASPFGERLAHGALVLSLVTGLRSRSGHYDESIVALAEVRSWRFQAPVLIGDTIRAHCRVIGAREVSASDRGLVIERVEVINQRDQIVQEGEFVTMLRRRSKA
ncbi:MAG: MaoC/PaaZ C-terminal domain-containing protein [Nocardioides sp.]|uniref:MaoC/PaaZ C-terminal domain-containing protein n=1 Tax=Nocardioides sp. TaxID=35761 RepID=UPI0039E27CD3